VPILRSLKGLLFHKDLQWRNPNNENKENWHDYGFLMEHFNTYPAAGEFMEHAEEMFNTFGMVLAKV
jgi:hypothetical protein